MAACHPHKVNFVGSNPTSANMNECEKCNGTGWVLEKVFQDETRADYKQFVGLLYLECECKKEKNDSNP